MSSLLLVAILLAGSLVLSALFLWFGARCVKSPKASFSRALLVAFVTALLANVLLTLTIPLQGTIASQNVLAPLIVPALSLIGALLISCVVIKSIFRTTLLRSFAVCGFQLIGGVVALAIVMGIVRPYILEALMVPSNSMAPTVVGWHTTSTCPHCQGLLIVPAQPPEDRPLPFALHRLGICSTCRKIGVSPAAGTSIQSPDRILVNKLLAARRWDMVAFRYPLEPATKYIKRLVGLPGETVLIKEGSIWINGSRVDPPAELAGLRYTTEFEPGVPIRFGTVEAPLRLERDEYCVLGDFSERASDSRFWGPVPAGNIDGVVSLCYWPASRWRVFR